MRAHPIPPVTEPLQYRAIGIVRGIYRPTDPEVFSRGFLLVDGGEEIEAVVLGKVITLMQRHVSVSNSHLWVVYPRSRNSNQLHLQISGIWEPSTLDKISNVKKPPKKNNKELDQLAEGDNYFSIRGELIYTKPQANEIVIRIRQTGRANRKKTMPFKLKLKGDISLDYLRHFVSLEVRRSGQELCLENYKVISPISSRGGTKKSHSSFINSN